MRSYHWKPSEIISDLHGESRILGSVDLSTYKKPLHMLKFIPYLRKLRPLLKVYAEILSRSLELRVDIGKINSERNLSRYDTENKTGVLSFQDKLSEFSKFLMPSFLDFGCRGFLVVFTDRKILLF